MSEDARAQRIADLRKEIASPRPAHISEAFHEQHIAAAKASLAKLLNEEIISEIERLRQGSMQ